MRFFFEISYLGTDFNGWQTQPNGAGVQEVVEQALSKLCKTPVAITGSGRTDTGVHCRSQYFHADLNWPSDLSDLLHRLNSFLPRSISIKSIKPVKPNANARFDAKSRTYHYIITRKKDPLLHGRALYFFKPLDVAAMQLAAKQLIGTHDFESFSKVKTDVNNFNCIVREARWEEADDLLIFSITANRFLRGMVRAIVGTLLDVGTGKISTADFKAIISGRDRKRAGMNVAPEGLYLMSVTYPASVFLKKSVH
jgi:tRNA pseudouridine38-40 synthase